MDFRFASCQQASAMDIHSLRFENFVMFALGSLEPFFVLSSAYDSFRLLLPAFFFWLSSVCHLFGRCEAFLGFLPGSGLLPN